MITDVNNTIQQINKSCGELFSLTNDELRCKIQALRKQVLVSNISLNEILEDVFSLVKEAMRRFTMNEEIIVTATEMDIKLAALYDYVVIRDGKAVYKKRWIVGGKEFVWDMIPYDVQLQGGVEIHQGKIIQMATGEGKTLVAVAPAILNALKGNGVHIVTVNDYLSRRDFEITRPIYSFCGFSVGCIEGLNVYTSDKKEAYNCDVIFGSISNFIFDYLYDNLSKSEDDCVQRSFNFCIIDEADSILVDEAQTSHRISDTRISTSKENLFEKYLPIVKEFIEECHDGYIIDCVRQKVELTGKGKNWIAEKTGILSLYNFEVIELEIENINANNGFTEIQKKELVDAENNKILELRNLQNVFYQLLRALTVFLKDRDYLVKDDKIIIIDTNTGRPKPTHRWSFGLHEAIIAKEGVSNDSDERCIIATISMKNYISMYQRISGMSGTAFAAKDEFLRVYGCEVAIIPPHVKNIRKDFPLRLFKSTGEKQKAFIDEIALLHFKHRPILVGCSTVIESERIANLLKENGYEFQLLNAKSLSNESDIISKAGAIGAITVATSIAGRGTDIKPCAESLAVGGLAVIGYGIAVSKRIDEQLAGRTGRQGNPGTSQFFVSFDDEIVSYLSNAEKDELENLFKESENGELQSKRGEELFYKAQFYKEQEDEQDRTEYALRDDYIDKHRHFVYTTRRKLLQCESDINSMLNIFSFYNEESFISSFEKNKTEIKKVALPIMGQMLANIHTLKKYSLIPFVGNGEVFSIVCDYEKAINDDGLSIVDELQRQVFLSALDGYWNKFINKIDTNLIPISDYKSIQERIFKEMSENVKNKLIYAKIANWNYFDENVDCQSKDNDERLISAKEEDIVAATDLCPCGSGKMYFQCHGKVH